MLAALLTAVVRALLPTAPGFLFMAPTAGSGKSLLASCVGVLAGVPRPARMPSTRQEEEFRKRLLAVARESRAAVLLDNVSGHIESDALCAYLTSDHYADRLLGVSNTVEVPVTGIFMVTGNNVTLVGDLNRRLLTCRIDPGVERYRTEEEKPTKGTETHFQPAQAWGGKAQGAAPRVCAAPAPEARTTDRAMPVAAWSGSTPTSAQVNGLENGQKTSTLIKRSTC